MTLLIQQNDIGEHLREPATLDRRRRLLSGLVKRHRIPGRPCIVSLHRRGAAYMPVDKTVRLRKTWKNTHVGPNDVVVITYLPLGGMGGGGQKGGKNIGAALGMLLMSIFVPWAVGAIAPAIGLGGVLGTSAGLTMAGKIVSMGIIAGIGYLISKATQPKANKEKEKEAYGVSGGGNVARAGDRIPVNYGRTWTQPDLTQADYFTYAEVGDLSDPDDMILYKRMCLGLGKYVIHKIKIGEAIAWTEEHGKQEPFLGMELEFIQPGQKSDLVPGAVYSSPNVNGIDMGYADDPIPWKGPFPVTEPGKRTRRVQIDWSMPNGYYYTGRHGKGEVGVGLRIEAIEIDDDGVHIGDYIHLGTLGRAGIATGAVRLTKMFTVDQTKRWAIRACPTHVNQSHHDNISVVDQVYWDGLRAHLDTEPARPHTTEIAMKVSANAMGDTMSFSDVWVEATKILPVYRNGTWVEEPTRKAVWAYADAVRNATYGGAVNDMKFDTVTAAHYASTVTAYDTFDGQIRGPVSVFEAAQTILGVMRAEPVVMGDVWSMTRDEPRQYSNHVITRRQIVKDTSGVEFDLDMTHGESDVIVSYFSECDPKRRNEVRETIGERTITPKRIEAFGVSSLAHARHLAKWFAATAYYRRENRLFTTEMQGRIFQRNESALVDCWFLNATKAAGVDGRDGTSLFLDQDIEVKAGDYLFLRTETGLNWGPVRVTAGAHTDEIVVNAADVATVEAYTGRPFGSLFVGRSNKLLPVTALIGPLKEIQQGYLLRSVRPAGMNRVEVQAVNDAPEVWSVLGEAIPPGPPVPGVIDNSVTVPVLPWVNANIIQMAGALYLQWSVGRAQNARRYHVQMAYAGAESVYVDVSNGDALDGNYPVTFDKNMIDPTVRVRARVINRLGVPSQWKYTTTSLFLPQVNPDLADLEVRIESLSQQLKYEMSLISGMGEASLGELRKRVADLIQELGATAATHIAETYEKVETIKAVAAEDRQNTFAAIQNVERAFANADEALAQSISTKLAQLDDTTRALISEERTARVTQDEALAQSINDMYAQISGDISGEASLRQQLTVRVNNVEGQVAATAQSLQTLSTTVNGNTSTLTTVQQSVNGVRLQYGVVGSINGQTGGFLLQGARRLDGSVTYTMGIHADLFVDGSITGRKISGSSLIISGRAQVGSLVIGTDQIIDGSLSTMQASEGTPPRVTIQTKNSNSRVLVLAVVVGKSDLASAQAYVRQNGEVIHTLPRDVMTEYALDARGEPTGSTAVTWGLSMIIIAPGRATVTYDMVLPFNRLGTMLAGRLAVVELAK